MKYLSKESSIETVKRLFSTTSNEDAVSIQNAFLAVGRDPVKVKENKDWLSNKLTHLKYHNLIKPIYSFKTGYRVLDKIQLTLEGKKALGRIETDVIEKNTNSTLTNPNNSSSSLTDLMQIIAKLRKDNPEYEITFDVKLKGNSV